MTITQVSQKYGLSQDTLRYYERIGIIPPVPRNKSGIRDYDEVSCSWIELMKCMRSSGVQIEALIEYVSLFQPLLFWEPALEQNGRNKGYSDRRQTNSATSQKQFVHIVHQINDGLCRLCAGFVPSLFQQKWLN